MKALSLLRHADADWGAKGSKDFDRPLSMTGQEQCLEVAAYITQRKIKPDLVLCSTAKRAIETCNRIDETLNDVWPIQETKALYLCDIKQLIEEIQLVSDDYDHLLIIGHNPALQEVSWLLSGKSDDTLMRSVETGFPPATLTTHSFNINQWSEVDKGRGVLKDVYKV